MVKYHEQTKHSPESVRSGPGLNFDNKPSPDKEYIGLPQEPLPEDHSPIETPALEAITVPQWEPPSDLSFTQAEPESIDRHIIAQLCHYSVGITKEIELRNRTVPFRAAACTGALYHVDLYPVCGDLPNLDAGVYHYNPPSHSLDILRQGDFRGWLASASEDGRIEQAPVTFIATSTWWRNAWKYRERTFRHSFWDSGTVLANLLAVAHAQGLPSSVVLSFADDDVVELLGLDPTEEAPVELIPVGIVESGSDIDSIDPISPETEPLSPNPQGYPLIHQAWNAGTLPNGSVAANWRDQASDITPVGKTEPDGGSRIPLDPVDRNTASARPLDNTIRRRGSCRAYERNPISFRKFSTILDRAIRGVPLDICPEHDGPLLYNDCYLIVNSVDGVDSGTYQYHANERELERLQAGEYRQEAGQLALGQRLAADAAVCMYFMTDLDVVEDEIGDRGYRAAQFEAAMTAGRLYLATYAHRSLGGTGLTFFDDLVTDFFRPRADGQTPMFLYTIGRPA